MTWTAKDIINALRRAFSHHHDTHPPGGPKIQVNGSEDSALEHTRQMEQIGTAEAKVIDFGANVRGIPQEFN